MRNDIDKEVIVSRITRLRIVTEYNIDRVFIVESYAVPLASNIPRRKN